MVKPRFLEDYRYLFSANAYTGITRENAWEVVATTVRDGIWMGKLTYPAALLAMFVAVICCRRLFRNPLIPSLMLWAFGYAAFLAYHNNLQPRYYLVIAVPLTMLPVVVAEEIYFATPGWLTPALPIARGAFVTIAGAVVAVILAVNVVQDVEVCEATGAHVSGRCERAERGRRWRCGGAKQDGVVDQWFRSLVDDWASVDLRTILERWALEDRVATYQPGWYATWNQVDDDKMDALAPMYHLGTGGGVSGVR